MEASDTNVPSVYCLTELTGKKSAGNRRVIIQGFDIQWRVFVILAVGFIPCVIITAIFWLPFHQMSLLTFPIFYAVFFYFVEGRSRDGLKLRRYQTMRDKKKTVNGRFYLCGREIDPASQTWATLRSTTVPSQQRPTTASVIDDLITGGPSATSARALRTSRKDELKAEKAERDAAEREARRVQFEKARADKAASKQAVRASRGERAATARTASRPSYVPMDEAELTRAADPFAELT